MLQFFMRIILYGLVIFNIICWIVTFLRNYWTTKNLPYITVDDKDLMEISKEPSPRISVLVPARNESHRVLRKCIESLCSQTYSNLEIIVVNDCSTDDTGDILDDLAKRNPRLKVVHGVPPPPGWLGKPHAMYQASQVATGDWLLATDADIIFHPKVISSAMDYVVKNQLDVLALMPGGEFVTFWEKVVLPVFVYFLVFLYPPHLANKPKSKHALASGGFILMRREAHQKIGGYERIKDYVIDDIFTAIYLKEAGYKFRVLGSRDTVFTRPYYGLSDIWEGFSKNTFAGLNHNFMLSFIAILFLMIVSIGPFLCLAGGLYWNDNLLVYLSGGSYLLTMIIFLGLDQRIKVPVGYALINWVGIVVLALIIFNSTWKQSTGQGVTWKSRIINPPEG